ncbi:YtxH domain-containing protein [Eubacterium multiforme]|uniref:Gas vesicle protein n=1 Tax=Eubacterium multiforme TaxID=83339 RepID=A0ABT9URU4_9FIRM|nr:YtxH domain-containing protein [Eubacterium multiforme]MDQ0148589.1 gas vesicle protein [Eubacterium multiforme]
MGKLIKGMAAGALIGTAVGMAMLPQLDRRTKRTMRRAGRKLANVASDTVENMMSMMK